MKSTGDKDIQVDTKKAQKLSDVSEFPDGGLRAWSVVLGVRPILPLNRFHVSLHVERSQHSSSSRRRSHVTPLIQYY